MKKRFLGLVLACVMLLTMLPTMAFAATTTFKVTSDKTKVNPGDEVTFTVALSAVDKLSALSFKLDIPTGLTFVSAAVANNLQSKLGMNGMLWNVDNKSFNAYGNMDGYTSSTDTTIMTFVCRVDNISNLPATLKVSLKETEMQDSDFDTTNPTASPATITVAAKTVAVDSVAVSPTSLNLEVGQTGTLTATVKPGNATNKTVTWTTSNDKVATVANNGVVTAVGKGTATITAAADGKTATCTVTVKEPAHVHDADVTVDAKASTCKEQGWEAYYKCSKCGAVVDKDGKAAEIKYLPLAAHKLTETKAVPATCTEDGTEAYWTCSVCKKMFADKDGKKEIKAPVKIDALGHDIVKNEDPAVVGVRGSKMWLYSATCKNCQKTVYVANLVMPENTINVIAKQSENSKKDFSKAVTFGVKASDSKETLKFTIDPVTDDIVKAAKTEAGYKVTETIYKGAYGWGLADYSETPEAAYAALAEYLKNGITFTQTISAKENTWAADAKSHTMTFDINTADGTFTVKVDGKNESTITFTNTFTYKTVSPGGGGSGSTTTDTTKNDGKKVESGKTFDAGIAMYVGLSVLSVTGGALVIGKKKERF